AERPAKRHRAPKLSRPPASLPEHRVPAPPPGGVCLWVSFLEGSSHGTVLVAALAEEVPAVVPLAPAAHIDARSIGRSCSSHFSARGHFPGRRPSPRGHRGGLQQRRQAGSRGRQSGIVFYLHPPEQP